MYDNVAAPPRPAPDMNLSSYLTVIFFLVPLHVRVIKIWNSFLSSWKYDCSPRKGRKEDIPSLSSRLVPYKLLQIKLLLSRSSYQKTISSIPFNPKRSSNFYFSCLLFWLLKYINRIINTENMSTN